MIFFVFYALCVMSHTYEGTTEEDEKTAGYDLKHLGSNLDSVSNSVYKHKQLSLLIKGERRNGRMHIFFTVLRTASSDI